MAEARFEREETTRARLLCARVLSHDPRAFQFLVSSHGHAGSDVCGYSFEGLRPPRIHRSHVRNSLTWRILLVSCSASLLSVQIPLDSPLAGPVSQNLGASLLVSRFAVASTRGNRLIYLSVYLASCILSFPLARARARARERISKIRFQYARWIFSHEAHESNGEYRAFSRSLAREMDALAIRRSNRLIFINFRGF